MKSTEFCLKWGVKALNKSLVFNIKWQLKVK